MKYWNYIVISIFVAFIFEIAGIPVASDLLTRVGISLEGSNLSNSLFYLSIYAFGGILIGITAGITIGSTTLTEQNLIDLLALL
jgi:hypothetical protein